MMLPILISVSVAPSSYFFCASVPVLDPARSANAATDAIAVLLKKTVMTFSLSSSVSGGCVWHGFLGRKLLMLLRPSIILPGRSQEKALRTRCGGLLL